MAGRGQYIRHESRRGVHRDRRHAGGEPEGDGHGLTNVDDIVIGTDWRIYHDSGPGWSWLGGGVASSTANAPGIFIESNDTIGVVGTDGNSWCNTTTLPGTWAGWRRC